MSDQSEMTPMTSAASDHIASPAAFLSWYDRWSTGTSLVVAEDPIRQAVAEVFNPPDGDDDETLILLRALFAARDFIAAHPCGCLQPDVFMDPCERCQLLGRLGDVRQDR